AYSGTDALERHEQWAKYHDGQPADEQQLLGVAWKRHNKDFLTLMRYRGSIERTLLRALRDLQACQAQRRARATDENRPIDISPTRDLVPPPTHGEKPNNV